MKTIFKFTLSLSFSICALFIISSYCWAGGTIGYTSTSCSTSSESLACFSAISSGEAAPSNSGSPHNQSSGTTTSASTTSTSSNSTAPPCPYAPFITPAGPPPGVAPGSGQWEVDTCDTLTQAQVDAASGPGIIWVSNTPGTSGPPKTAGPPSVATLAAQAEAELPLPTPTPSFSPAGTAYVNLPEWLWIDASIWHPYTVTAAATAGGVTVIATATAVPVGVVWNMGDNPTPPTDCAGPGTPYDPNEPAAEQHTTCEHTYTVSSLGQPTPDGNPNDAAFPVTVSVDWQVTWSGSGGATGTLPPVVTTAHTSLRVEQIESALCATSCPPG